MTKLIGGVIMGSGIFGSLFDFNGDGKLDAFERGMEFMAFRFIYFPFWPR